MVGQTGDTLIDVTIPLLKRILPISTRIKRGDCLIVFYIPPGIPHTYETITPVSKNKKNVAEKITGD